MNCGNNQCGLALELLSRARLAPLPPGTSVAAAGTVHMFKRILSTGRIRCGLTIELCDPNTLSLPPQHRSYCLSPTHNPYPYTTRARTQPVPVHNPYPYTIRTRTRPVPVHDPYPYTTRTRTQPSCARTIAPYPCPNIYVQQTYVRMRERRERERDDCILFPLR